MELTPVFGIKKPAVGDGQKEVIISESFDIIEAALQGRAPGITQTAPHVPAARVYHNAAQSVAHNTLVALAFNSERYDTDVIHDTATNNSRLVCKTAGLYSVKGCAAFAASATGIRQVNIRLNGATYLDGLTLPAAGAADATMITVTTDYFLAANDYVELIAYQTSGGALNVTASANQSPEFMMKRVG